MEIIKAHCKHCGKEMLSLYQKQLDYNMNLHELSCQASKNITKILKERKNGN